MSKVTIEGFVVREADGRLWLCEDKPTRANDGDYWWALNEFGMNKDLFPEVTWETEPKPCKITIEI